MNGHKQTPSVEPATAESKAVMDKLAIDALEPLRQALVRQNYSQDQRRVLWQTIQRQAARYAMRLDAD